MYDQRLFNQDPGTAAGFGAEDTYNTYDKPLFADRGAVARHRPTGGDEDEEAERSFKPDKVCCLVHALMLGVGMLPSAAASMLCIACILQCCSDSRGATRRGCSFRE